MLVALYMLYEISVWHLLNVPLKQLFLHSLCSLWNENVILPTTRFFLNRQLKTTALISFLAHQICTNDFRPRQDPTVVRQSAPVLGTPPMAENRAPYSSPHHHTLLRWSLQVSTNPLSFLCACVLWAMVGSTCESRHWRVKIQSTTPSRKRGVQ